MGVVLYWVRVLLLRNRITCLGGNTLKTIEYSVPQRTVILYTPIGLMTSRNVFTLGNEHLLIDAAGFISNLYYIFRPAYKSQKAVIHCGNLGKHGEILNKYLSCELGFTTILHERGKLKQTIEEFLDGDAHFLLVVSAEYGVDFKDIDLQFILKVPFAAKDERMNALEKSIGKKAFKEYYTMDALNRLVQQSGRVGRGAGGFGCTFILDSKFEQLYRKYNDKLPGWFRDRLILEV